MTIKTALTAFALVLAPGLALAECDWSKQTASMSCADGMTYDSATQACVPTTS
ncbi:hypothetical protein LX81_01302 [Palleronia aestuarii]|uniref:Chitin binding peritrophin-A-like protein n=1 Tax=Palleronia aestuarii TaxID=568105 RepID=A0A2W7NH97_9RHOB|nr:hypothetical protein [Palleronia aestuarii]PZX17577.1 hypothetical protein LX81_01302 [Palleronia aestuarii]